MRRVKAFGVSEPTLAHSWRNIPIALKIPGSGSKRVIACLRQLSPTASPELSKGGIRLPLGLGGLRLRNLQRPRTAEHNRASLYSSQRPILVVVLKEENHIFRRENEIGLKTDSMN